MDFEIECTKKKIRQFAFEYPGKNLLVLTGLFC